MVELIAVSFLDQMSRELNDDFDVVGLSLQRLLEILRLFTARDQAAQPLPVGARQILTCPVPVALVGIDAADDHVVLQAPLPPRCRPWPARRRRRRRRP